MAKLLNQVFVFLTPKIRIKNNKNMSCQFFRVIFAFYFIGISD